MDSITILLAGLMTIIVLILSSMAIQPSKTRATPNSGDASLPPEVPSRIPILRNLPQYLSSPIAYMKQNK
jgi:hypothetical protein